MTQQATANTEKKMIKINIWIKVSYPLSLASCCLVLNAKIESKQDSENVDAPITQICQLKISAFHLDR